MCPIASQSFLEPYQELYEIRDNKNYSRKELMASGKKIYCIKGTLDIKRLENAFFNTLGFFKSQNTTQIKNEPLVNNESNLLKNYNFFYDLSDKKLNQQLFYEYLELFERDQKNPIIIFPIQLYLFKIKSNLFFLVEEKIIFSFEEFPSEEFNQVLYYYYNCGKNGEIKDTKEFFSFYKNCVDHKDITPVLIEKQKMYWRQKLIGLNLDPFELGNSHVTSIKRISSFFDKDEREKIEQFTNDFKINPASLITSIFSILIYKYWHQNQFIIGVPANFRSENCSKLLDSCIEHLPLLVKIDEKEEFLNFLNRLFSDYKEISDYKYGFPLVATKNEDEKNHSESICSFDVLISCEFSNVNKLSLPCADISLVEMYPLHRNEALHLLFYLVEDGLQLTLSYKSDLEEKFFKQFLSHLKNLVSDFLKNPRQSIMASTVLSDEESEKILFQWNDTSALFPVDKTLKDIFEEQAKNNPSNIALNFNNRRYTYNELNNQANKVAHKLIQHFVGPEKVVGILLKPSVELIVGILGVLKAGGAYLPIDIGLPEERISFMLKDTDSYILLTQTIFLDKAFNLLSALPFLEVLDLDDMSLFDNFDANPCTTAKQESLAYIIYTSGSTGQPKGVMIEQKQCINTMYDIVDKYCISNKDKTLLISNIGFDLSVFDIFGAFIAGSTLVIPNEDGSKSQMVSEWKQCILDNHVTIWNSAPLLMCSLLDSINEEESRFYYGTLRLVLLSGDWIPLNLPERIRRVFGENIQIVSLGGATEGSIWSIYYPVKEIEKNWKSIPYGRPLANQKILILDNNLHLCPPGVMGEIHIGGMGVARGYANRPELTKERFIENPFITPQERQERKDSRLYKTGDLGKYRFNGEVQILGRIDHQVKVRGVRIEIGEIEHHLNRCDFIEESIIIDMKDSGGERFLVCFYIVKDIFKNSFSHINELKNIEKTIRCHLRRFLPDQMIPSFLIRIEKIPLTVNGKADRKSLEKLFDQFNKPNYIAPDTITEKTLCSLWEESLRLKNIGVNNDFFAIGGNSLQAIRLCHLISKSFGCQLRENIIFENPTIRKLAYYLEKKLESH